MALSRQPTNGSDADYEHENIDLNEYGEHHPNGHNDTASIVSEDDSSYLNQTIEEAMAKLKRIHGEQGSWDKALKHKHGVGVYVRKDTVNVEGKDKKIPLYKGELLMDGFAPSAVFSITAQRKLWDDWYDSGNLVADLNDSTSLTYMNMKPPGTARPRDIALIEKVEATSDGTIFFCATSINSHKIPHVHGRTRAHMVLNGWVLSPVQKAGQLSTMTSYYLQVEPHGLLPGAVASRLMARRPVALYKILEHLKKNGAPPNGAASSQERHQQPQANGHANGVAVAGAGAAGAGVAAAAVGSERKPETNGTSAHDEEGALESTLPPQAPFKDSHSSAGEIKTAKRKFEEALSERSWEQARDSAGSTIYMKKNGTGEGLPTVRGKATVEGVTTEQVLGTIASTSARRIWDEQFSTTEVVENINSCGEQSIAMENRKGIHPHLETQSYRVAKAVMREEPNSDNGQIDCISRSYESEQGSGTVDFSGWRLSSQQHDTVNMEHISSVSLGKQVPDFVERIILTSEAAQPRRVAEFINRHGFAPFFLRWGKGIAVLEEELEGDMKEGRTSWRIGSSGTGKEGDGQVAWLQWSERMYPHGISLNTSASANAIKPSLIEGSETTLQLAFTGDLPDDGCTLQIEPGNGSNSSDVTWNEHQVSDKISAPRGTGMQRKAAAGAGGAAVVGGAAAASRKKEERPSEERCPAAKTPSSPNGVATASSNSRDRDTGARDSPVAVEPSSKTVVERRLEVPEDAMLILTKDLYFTRDQMAVIGALLVVVWALTRFG